MRKSILWIAVIVTVCLFSGNATLAHGQTSNSTANEKSAQQPKSEAGDEELIQAYRLDFLFDEVEDGKKINTRHYTMDLTQEGKQAIKIGTRVPVVSGGYTTGNNGERNTQYQYLDVGTNIEGHMNRMAGGDVELRVNCEVSNIDTTAESSKIAPVIRQIKIEGATLLSLGKPLLIGSVDDPNSKRQFQLEVTVTKLR